MHNHNIAHLFGSLLFNKTGDEIKKKAIARITFLETKIKEREERIARVHKDYGISDADLLEALSHYEADLAAGRELAYTNQTANSEGVAGLRSINAGVLSQLHRERKLIMVEREQINKFSLMARNLHDGEVYRLNFNELEILDF